MRTCNLCRIECFYNYVYTFLFYYGVISRFIAYSSSLFLLNISLFQLCLKYIQYSICVKRSVRCSKPKLFYCIIYELIPLGGRFSPWIWWQNQHVIHVRELLVFGDCWPNLLVVFLFRLRNCRKSESPSCDIWKIMRLCQVMNHKTRHSYYFSHSFYNLGHRPYNENL